MPKNPEIKKVLMIGSGPIVIGQAAEFDYAGTQACRSLKEEGIEVVLLNSNPATIMTDKDIADKVKSLTSQQLQDVFTAKVTNWKEVGGPDEPIVLVTRPTTSGTRALFTELALAGQEEASNKSLETDDSGTLIQSVAQTKGAIGYVALPYLVNNKDVAALAIDGVAPTLENTYNGTYKVWGYEHMYTKGEPTGAVKAFLDYILSDEYGVEIEKQGYGVSSKMKK